MATRVSDAPEGRTAATLARALAFEHLKWISFAHSLVYAALLVCAFGAGNPQPLTFVLGLAHGLIWIGMSVACIMAARLRVLPLRVATAVAVLGGIGPFFGSAEFIRERRRRARTQAL
jgi:hypothetical protein